MSGALRRAVMLVCLMLLASAGTALAQVSMGEVFGKVTDGTGAVLPGVTVTLSGPALIQPQTTVTAASGAYRFPRIPIGTYSVAFELTGFKKSVRDGIIIQAGFNAEIDTKLEISTVQETVTVSGGGTATVAMKLPGEKAPALPALPSTPDTTRAKAGVPPRGS